MEARLGGTGRVRLPPTWPGRGRGGHLWRNVRPGRPARRLRRAIWMGRPLRLLARSTSLRLRDECPMLALTRSWRASKYEAHVEEALRQLNADPSLSVDAAARAAADKLGARTTGPPTRTATPRRGSCGGWSCVACMQVEPTLGRSRPLQKRPRKALVDACEPGSGGCIVSTTLYEGSGDEWTPARPPDPRACSPSRKPRNTCGIALAAYWILRPSTLARKRTDGGGPRFVLVTRRPYYPVTALDEFLDGELGREVRNTADEFERRRRVIEAAAKRLPA